MLLKGEKVFRRLVFHESVTGRRQDVSRYVSLRQHVAVSHRKNSFDMLQAEAPMPCAFPASSANGGDRSLPCRPVRQWRGRGEKLIRSPSPKGAGCGCIDPNATLRKAEPWCQLVGYS